MTAILDKHSQCVSLTCSRSMICWPMAFGQAGVYTDVFVVLYVWVRRMLIGLSMVKKTTFFDCHRCMLDRRNPLRNNTKAFWKGFTIRKGPPKRLTSLQIKEWHARLKSGKRNDKGQFEGYGEVHNWTHISLLGELPYAEALILPFNIDLMHQERNFCESLISMCCDVTNKSKDNIKARKDLEEQRRLQTKQTRGICGWRHACR